MTRLEGWAWLLVVVLLIIAGIYAGMTQKTGKGGGAGAPKSSGDLGAGATHLSAPASALPNSAAPGRRGGDSPTIMGVDAVQQQNPAVGTGGGTLSFGPGGETDAKTLFSQVAHAQRQEEFGFVGTGSSPAGGQASGGNRGAGSFRMPDFGFSSGGFSGSIPTSIGGGSSPGGTSQIVAVAAIPTGTTGSGAPGNTGGDSKGGSPVTGGITLPGGAAMGLCK